MFGYAVLTSVPQPIAAVVAFYFVRIAIEFLGFGYGLSAGAMLYLVVADVLPDGLESVFVERDSLVLVSETE